MQPPIITFVKHKPTMYVSFQGVKHPVARSYVEEVLRMYRRAGFRIRRKLTFKYSDSESRTPIVLYYKIQVTSGLWVMAAFTYEKSPQPKPTPP